MDIEVPTTGHRPGDYGLQIGRRQVVCACQQLQSADNGLWTGDNRSRVSDHRSWASKDSLRASHDGSPASNNGSCAGTYVCTRMHSYASKVYKGGEVSLRHTALFLLFLLLNMSGRATISTCDICSTRPPLHVTTSAHDHFSA